MAINYLTPEGFNRIRAEIRQLLDVERSAIVKSVNEAAAMGDRSENAEYIYGKRRLREIDRRIGFLQRRLDNVEVVDPSKISLDKVSFGALVKLENEDGETSTYQVLGEDEIDAKLGRITFSSPLGRALLGKKVDDEVIVQKPGGPAHYTVLKIERPKG